MKKFKYRTLMRRIDDIPSDGTLNSYGIDGWELVSIIKGTCNIMLIFKKEYDG